MAVWGKIIGGAVGSIGGPIGIAIGAAMGHQFDRSTETSEHEDHIEIAYMFILVASMAKMAKADGQVTQDEIQKVNALFSELGLEGEEKKAAQDIFRSEKNSDSDIGEYFDQFSKLTEADLTQAQILYSLLLDVAKADGQLHKGELHILHQAESKLRLPMGYTEREVGNQHNSRKHASEVLGIAEFASEDDIKKAYRAKCKEMHPDTLQRHGLPAELIKHAAAQIQSYTDARDILLK